MQISSDIIIYTVVFVLSFITFFGFIKIGVKRIAHTSTARPLLFFVLSLVVVGALGVGIKNLAFEPDVKMLLPEKFPARTVYEEIIDSFGGVDTVYICVTAENGTVWDPHILSKIRDISRTLKSAPYVNKVMSITETKAILNEEDMMKVSTIVPENITASSPQEIAAIRSSAQANDLLFKRLISADEKSALIAATVNISAPVKSADGKQSYKWLQDKDICELIPGKPDTPTLLNIMDKYKDPSYKLTLTGFPYLRYNIWLQMESDMRLFLVLGIIVMLGFLYASFKTLRGMLLPLTVVSLGLVASFGFMGWMHEKITLPFLIMGPMLIAIAHNYGTQLIAKYYEDVQEATGPFTRESIRNISENCIISIGAPVLISAVTVIIGFVTMISHPIRGLALLGFFSAFGIIISFILTIILTPAILSLLNIPQLLMTKSHGAKTDQILKAIAQFTANRRYEMLAGTVILSLVCLSFIPRIESDANVMNHFPKDSFIYKDADFISEKFGGYSTLNVLIKATHPVADDAQEDGPLKQPSTIKWMDDFQKFALAQTDPNTNTKLIGDALSMTDFLSYMNKVMKNDPAEFRVPTDQNLIAQYLLSYEGQSGGDLESLVDYKYNQAQIVLRLPDMSTPRLKVLTENLKQYIKDHPNENLDISFGGTAAINTEIGAMIVDGQVWSLALSVIIIVFCYMIFFRSVSAGLLASVPLFCAIVLVFGLMGIFDIDLDYITATLTGISIGAGTDYTAYFLWRLRERASATGDLVQGYIETMTTIGKGIVYNGLSVVVGFFVFLLSNFIPIRFFGFLISFSILACIVSTLTILPVVIFLVKPKFLMQSSPATEPGMDVPVAITALKPQPEVVSYMTYSASSSLDRAYRDKQ